MSTTCFLQANRASLPKPSKDTDDIFLSLLQRWMEAMRVNTTIFAGHFVGISEQQEPETAVLSAGTAVVLCQIARGRKILIIRQLQGISPAGK